MGFTPQKAKGPLLGMEFKVKETEKDRKVKQSANTQNVCSHWSSNNLDYRSNERSLQVKNLSLAVVDFRININLLV